MNFQKKYGHSIKDCGLNEEIASYIYIDDAIYTGNRVIRDIEKWSQGIDIQTALRLDIIVYALHERNLDYKKSKIEEIIPGVKIEIWRGMIFSDDLKNSKYQYECYWPSMSVTYNDQTQAYIESVESKRTDRQKEFFSLLRKNGEPLKDEYFTNAEKRKIVESIFFEKGVDIVSSAQNKNFRPMGYDYQHTLGFGSYFVSYRNIANNCPVVLWWGDLEGHSGINNWYPLFPRKANN